MFLKVGSNKRKKIKSNFHHVDFKILLINFVHCSYQAAWADRGVVTVAVLQRRPSREVRRNEQMGDYEAVKYTVSHNIWSLNFDSHIMSILMKTEWKYYDIGIAIIHISPAIRRGSPPRVRHGGSQRVRTVCQNNWTKFCFRKKTSKNHLFSTDHFDSELFLPSRNLVGREEVSRGNLKDD